VKTHKEMELLLPWHVNGTLSAKEEALLDRHLLECSDCNTQLSLLSELNEVIGHPSREAVPSRDILAETLRQIQNESAPKPQPHQSSRSMSALLKQVASVLMPAQNAGILALAAILMCVVLYQNLWQIPEMQTASPAVTLSLKNNLRAARQEMVLSPEEALMLKLDHPVDLPRFDLYSFKLEGAGRSSRTGALTAPDNNEPYLLNFQKGWSSGEYTLTLFGQQNGITHQLATYDFVILRKEE